MAATYYVLVADELMAGDLQLPEGFRFLEQVCPEPGRPDVHWWSAEDDGAPETLNGTRVEPLLGLEDGHAVILGRRPA